MRSAKMDKSSQVAQRSSTHIELNGNGCRRQLGILSFSQGGNGLRNMVRIWVKIPKNIPQGLKPY
jgi:hypothetical protein